MPAVSFCKKVIGLQLKTEKNIYILDCSHFGAEIKYNNMVLEKELANPVDYRLEK